MLTMISFVLFFPKIVKEIAREVTTNMTLGSCLVREDDDGKLAFDAPTQKILERNQQLRAALDAYNKAQPADVDTLLAAV